MIGEFKWALWDLLRRIKWSIRQRRIRLDFGSPIVEAKLKPSVGEPVVFSKPETIEIANPIYPSLKYIFSYQYRSIWLLKNACFDFRRGTLTLAGHVVSNVSASGAIRDQTYFRWPCFTRRNITEIATAVGQRSFNYYHWLIEDLPALITALKFQPGLKVFVASHAPNYVSDLLALLAIPFEKASGKVRFSDFVAVDRGPHAGWPHRDDLLLLREKLLKSVADRVDSKKAVFVSRSHSRRNYWFEEALEDHCRAVGLEIIRAENLTIEEQIRLFSRVSLIIGVHGAGLANMVFCSKETKVLEIVAASRINLCFEVMAVNLGFQFERVIWDPDQSPESDQKFLENLKLSVTTAVETRVI